LYEDGFESLIKRTYYHHRAIDYCAFEIILDIKRDYVWVEVINEEPRVAKKERI
jgi:hypothetical protein